MSMFCGKCDLYDSIFMISNSDDLSDKELFEKFMKETGGVIYQYKTIKLNVWNINHEIELTEKYPELNFLPSENLKSIEIEKSIPDKRFKKGFKTQVTYKYEWNYKTFNSLEELNKYGYSRKVPIKINTLLDLVKYFPYLISMQVYAYNKKIVVISDESYIDTMKSNAIAYGHDNSKLIDVYENNLKQYAINLIKEEY